MTFNFHHQNNIRDSIINKRNKLKDGNIKGTSTNTRKTIEINNQKNINYNKSNQIILNNGLLKNDTYESVCSPEDVEERIKLAQLDEIVANSNNDTIDSMNNNRQLKRTISAPVSNGKFEMFIEQKSHVN